MNEPVYADVEVLEGTGVVTLYGWVTLQRDYDDRTNTGWKLDPFGGHWYGTEQEARERKDEVTKYAQRYAFVKVSIPMDAFVAKDGSRSGG